MTIGELVCNNYFSFNAPFRVLHYLGTGDDVVLKFDSETVSRMIDGDDSVLGVPKELLNKEITAINVGDDGVLEIEYMNFDLY